MNSMSDSSIDLSQQLIQDFSRLKELLKQEDEEKVVFLKEKQLFEENKSWFYQQFDQLRQQLEEQKVLINTQQKSLTKFNELKEDNCRMKSSLLSMNELLNQKEESNNRLIEKMKSDFSFELNELKNNLESNEVEMKRLNDLINEKEIVINKLRTELDENKFNIEKDKSEMKNDYQSKIDSFNKEWIDKYNKCLQLNDEKIIDIKANCLRTIEKTKEEYESQLMAVKNENKDLSERFSLLRLEFEARKMTPFMNQSKGNNTIVKSSRTNVATVVPNRSTNENRQKVSIQVLDSKSVQIEPMAQLIPPKRKKLTPNNDLYLQFLKDET